MLQENHTYSRDRNTACIGAAILAGKGAGVFGNEKEGYERLVKRESEISPDLVNHEIYTDLFEIYRKRFAYLKSCYEL